MTDIICPECKSDNVEQVRVDSCSCHISPPCSACVDAPLICQDCQHEVEIEPEPIRDIPSWVFTPVIYKTEKEMFDELADGVFGYVSVPYRGWGMKTMGKCPVGFPRDEVFSACGVCKYGVPAFTKWTGTEFEFTYTYN